MKKSLLVTVIAMIMGFSTLVQADLFPGTQNFYDRGGGLIYDADLNITWYDYTYTGPQGRTAANWYEAMTWAAGLTVAGLTGWRLPATVDGPWVNGDDGTTTAGYNITSSEMGHLYYVSLGNTSEGGLTNKGPFTNPTPTYILDFKNGV